MHVGHVRPEPVSFLEAMCPETANCLRMHGAQTKWMQGSCDGCSCTDKSSRQIVHCRVGCEQCRHSRTMKAFSQQPAHADGMAVWCVASMIHGKVVRLVVLDRF